MPTTCLPTIPAPDVTTRPGGPQVNRFEYVSHLGHQMSIAGVEFRVGEQGPCTEGVWDHGTRIIPVQSKALDWSCAGTMVGSLYGGIQKHRG